MLGKACQLQGAQLDYQLPGGSSAMCLAHAPPHPHHFLKRPPMLPSQIMRMVLDGERPPVPPRERLPGPDTASFVCLDDYLQLMRCVVQGPWGRRGRSTDLVADLSRSRSLDLDANPELGPHSLKRQLHFISFASSVCCPLVSDSLPCMVARPPAPWPCRCSAGCLAASTSAHRKRSVPGVQGVLGAGACRPARLV